MNATTQKSDGARLFEAGDAVRESVMRHFDALLSILTTCDMSAKQYRALNSVIEHAQQFAALRQRVTGVKQSQLRSVADVRRSLCYGEQDENCRPTCTGPDVRRVRATLASGETIITSWCAECRNTATVRDGAQVKVLR